jgi:hypothetical protein
MQDYFHVGYTFVSLIFVSICGGESRRCYTRLSGQGRSEGCDTELMADGTTRLIAPREPLFAAGSTTSPYLSPDDDIVSRSWTTRSGFFFAAGLNVWLEDRFGFGNVLVIGTVAQVSRE